MNPGSDLLEKGFDELSTGFGHYILESLFEPSDSSGKRKATTFSVLFFIALMTYAGVEFLKITFRKNFGKKGLSSVKLIFVGIALGIIATIAFIVAFKEDAPDHQVWFGDQKTALWTGIIYIVLILYVAIIGFIEKGKVGHEIPAYRGTSKILGFMINEGWKPAKVQDLIEPLLLAAIGVALLSTSVLLGAPLIFFSVSYWLHLFAERLMNFHKLREELANQGHKIDEESTFVEVL